MSWHVGQAVQYYPSLGPNDDSVKANGNSGPIAAIITRVWSDTLCSLCVFTDIGTTVWKGSVTPNLPLDGIQNTFISLPTSTPDYVETITQDN